MKRYPLILAALLCPVSALAAPTLGGEGDDSASGPGAPGQPETDDAEEGFIINGRDATIDDFPMTGGLLGHVRGSMLGSPLDSVMFLCSSTLIAPDVVLTAAHCVDEAILEEQSFGLMQVDDLTVAWSQQVDLSAYGIGGTNVLPSHAHAGWEAAMHPDWVGGGGLQVGIAQNHDIALLFLDRPIHGVPVGFLPTPQEAELIDTDVPVTIVGWGLQQPVGLFEEPPPGSVSIKQIAESFLGEVGPFEFQVGVGPDSSRKCQGDSGGPTFLQVESEVDHGWRVIGVTSHAYDETQCQNTGGVDTRVDPYLEWIDEEMTARCDDGSRSWCEVPGIVGPEHQDVLEEWTPAEPDDSEPDPHEPEPDDEDPGTEDDDAQADSSEANERGGCGCSNLQQATAPWAVLMLLGAVAIRRRRLR